VLIYAAVLSDGVESVVLAPALAAQPGLVVPVIIGAAVLGGMGTYLVTRRAFRRLMLLSQAARDTSVRSLDTRISLGGPEDEIKEIADAFDDMIERLRLAFERQGQFMGDVAHELRTPLATLRTNLEVVTADPNATLHDYQEMSAVFGRTLGRLERLMDDLLLLATEARLPASEKVELGALLRELLGDLEFMAGEARVRLRLSAGRSVIVRGDRAILARAFGNLIENAIRYNRQGGEAEVTVTVAAAPGGPRALVTVRDTGIGMAAQDRARAFDRFYRADRSRARNKGGAGLGLSIVAKIVRQYGGEIRVESTPDEGTLFTVLLPV
jgi:signal transduction histidine kinase